MEIWYYWALAALLLFIVEMFTTGFAVICISIGAAGAAIGAALDTSLEMQFIIFAVVSMLALLGVRPLLKRLFYNKGEKMKTKYQEPLFAVETFSRTQSTSRDCADSFLASSATSSDANTCVYLLGGDSIIFTLGGDSTCTIDGNNMVYYCYNNPSEGQYIFHS